MKKIFKILFLNLIFLTFFSCASTQVTESSSNKDNQQKEEKLRFDDWKYKGFGNELPDWVEPAIDMDLKTLKKMSYELENSSSIDIYIGWGENLDQAEQSAKELASKNLENDSMLVLYDSFWVREYDTSKLLEKNKPYAAVYVYYKE